MTDADAGFIHGVPDAQYYLASQDPVDVGLLLFVASSIFLLAWIIRAIQFHSLVSFLGPQASMRDRVRAYLYGSGMDRLLPFNLGLAALASALEGQGVDREQATQAAFMSRLFHVLEIAALGIVGLLMVGWTTFLGQLFWGLLILGIAWLVVRRRGGERGEVLVWGKQALGYLAQHPVVFARLGILSLVAIALEPIGAYVVSQSFTSPNILLNIDFGVLVMGVVVGSVARLLTLTPGGIGQFEWGFAAALYVGGTGIPEAVTVAILFSFVRYLIDMIVLGRYVIGTLILGSSVTFGFKVETSLRQVLSLASTAPSTTPARSRVSP